MDTPQFMGRAACELLQQHPLRQVVGFVTDHHDAARPIEECHLVIDSGQITGRVTSVAYSPTLKHTIGIAVVEGASMTASEFQIRIGGGKLVRAERSPMPFYDPVGLRLTEVSV
jgi:sarcosine oxidase subunit alpha